MTFTGALENRKHPSLDLKSEIISGTRQETTFSQSFMRGLDWLLGSEQN
jgi:hypothetical protein